MYNYPARKPVRRRAQLERIRPTLSVDSIFFINLRRVLYKRSDPRLELILKLRTDG